MRIVCLLTFGFLLIIAGIPACGSGDGEASTDGDQEASDADGEDSLCLGVGQTCADNGDCCSELCWPDDRGAFCSTLCSSDGECSDLLQGSCCLRILGQNICALPSDCGMGDADFLPEIDIEVVCEPDQRRCEGNVVMVCDRLGSSWEEYATCNASETCVEGDCRYVDGDTTDGDDSDGDIDGNQCGNPDDLIAPILRRAEDLFRETQSTPTDAAAIVTSDNPDFEDDTYVRLNATEDGFLNGDLQELAFLVDINITHLYNFYINYACGPNWGEVALFLDDETTPLKTTGGDTKLSLHCSPSGGYDAALEAQVVYEPVCLSGSDLDSEDPLAGVHWLRMRVFGRDAAESNGYVIGADYISLLPAVAETEGGN